jgi:hypothetical protein
MDIAAGLFPRSRSFFCVRFIGTQPLLDASLKVGAGATKFRNGVGFTSADLISERDNSPVPQSESRPDRFDLLGEVGAAEANVSNGTLNRPSHDGSLWQQTDTS